MNSSFDKKLFITKIYKKFNRQKSLFRTLMYHSIYNEKIENEINDMWKLSLSLFKKQINSIKENKNKKIYKTEILLSECPNHGISITFDDGYLDTYEMAAPFLIENNVPFTIFVITNFIKNKKKGYMEESMLKELSKNSLVSIGSHSMNHYKLTEINNSLILDELKFSKLYLEDLLGKEISIFSYPHGKINKKVKEKVCESGYKLAFSSKFNGNNNNQDKLELCRSEIWNTDQIEVFNEKIDGDWDWLKYRNL